MTDESRNGRKDSSPGMSDESSTEMTDGSSTERKRSCNAIDNFIFLPLLIRFFKRTIGKSNESLCIKIPDETDVPKSINIGNDHAQHSVQLEILNPTAFCFRLLLDPKTGLGEAYMYSDYNVQPSLQEFLALLIRAKKENKERHNNPPSCSLILRIFSTIGDLLVKILRYSVSFLNACKHRLRSNTIEGSRRNIHDHYELGNAMFRSFLDTSMTYSCAIFDREITAEDLSNMELLKEAQMRKYDLILDQMDVTADDHVLEIGCGWGAFAIRAVKKYHCRWTALTIAYTQYKVARMRSDKEELSGQIDVQIRDYRLEKGFYTKIVAIEMIEAVGHEFLPMFFRILYERLLPGGKIFLQAITCPDAYYDRYCRSSDFIKKHIFPGGHLPSEKAIKDALPPSLIITKTKHIGCHYAVTLDFWHKAWMTNKKFVVSLGYGEVFHRKWEFYFALCSTLFRYGHIDTVQIVIEKKVQ